LARKTSASIVQRTKDFDFAQPREVESRVMSTPNFLVSRSRFLDNVSVVSHHGSAKDGGTIGLPWQHPGEMQRTIENLLLLF
jgi:hypothetical protein